LQYRIDKISGNKLSVLGFGCMRFPRSFAKTEELIIRAVEKGVNYFDTAWVYPGSEETLGAILKKNNMRDKVYIATKLPLVFLSGNKTDFDKYFNESLRRLQTDYIDYYLMHMITDLDQWQKLKSAGIEEWITRKKKSGQVKHIGFSFHGAGSEFLKVVDAYAWEFCLMQYNYSDENYQAGVTGLRAAAAKMPVMIMEPLLGGKLAAGLPKDAVKIFKEANPALSPAGWALNWVWNQSEVTLLLSGMNSLEQLEENLQLADSAAVGMIGETQMDVYKSALVCVKRACKINCTGCNYCMPCPAGVNIPGSFSAYNMLYAMGFYSGFQQYIMSTGFTSEKGSSPVRCIKCGKCETHCPQKIPIMKELVRVRKKMEPWPVQCIGACVRAFLGKSRKKKNAK
jgi:predicted aldo/keto reductase-like oxidoreductase